MSRAAHEELRAYARSLETALARHRVADGEERARYDALLDKYHALRVVGANAKEPAPLIPAPKQPPRVIMNAIRAISPREDAAFAANLKLYRDNEEDADADPDAFAERIKRGRLEGEPVTVAD